MTPEHLRILGILAGAVLVVAVLSPIGNRVTRRRLERWAQERRLRLVEFKTAPAWSGPRAWFRTENQEDHFVVVEDAAGNQRTGWVLFSWSWHGLGPKKVEVRWDEEDELVRPWEVRGEPPHDRN
jgi:hypothetical protein